MPIYEYQCDACGERLEKLQRMSDDKLVDCPACGKPALQRLVSAAAFRLKGGGWYETDFKKDNKRNLADGGSGSGSGSSTGGTSSGSDSSANSAGSSDSSSGSASSSSSSAGSKKTQPKPATQSSDK